MSGDAQTTDRAEGLTAQKWRSLLHSAAKEAAGLRTAIQKAEADMRYAAEELRKARRPRQHHTMVAAADEARAALVEAIRG